MAHEQDVCPTGPPAWHEALVAHPFRKPSRGTASGTCDRRSPPSFGRPVAGSLTEQGRTPTPPLSAIRGAQVSSGPDSTFAYTAGTSRWPRRRVAFMRQRGPGGSSTLQRYFPSINPKQTQRRDLCSRRPLSSHLTANKANRARTRSCRDWELKQALNRVTPSAANVTAWHPRLCRRVGLRATPAGVMSTSRRAWQRSPQTRWTPGTRTTGTVAAPAPAPW